MYLVLKSTNNGERIDGLAVAAEKGGGYGEMSPSTMFMGMYNFVPIK